MQRDYNGYNYHSCLIRVLKSQKKKLVPSYPRFFFAVKKDDWMINENLFLQTNQYSVISLSRENSKMFNTTSKYFSNFNNKPLASWVAHIAKDFFTCYSCSYSWYCSKKYFANVWIKNIGKEWMWKMLRDMVLSWSVYLRFRIECEGYRYFLKFVLFTILATVIRF